MQGVPALLLPRQRGAAGGPGRGARHSEHRATPAQVLPGDGKSGHRSCAERAGAILRRRLYIQLRVIIVSDPSSPVLSRGCTFAPRSARSSGGENI